MDFAELQRSTYKFSQRSSQQFGKKLILKKAQCTSWKFWEFRLTQMFCKLRRKCSEYLQKLGKCHETLLREHGKNNNYGTWQQFRKLCKDVQETLFELYEILSSLLTFSYSFCKLWKNLRNAGNFVETDRTSQEFPEFSTNSGRFKEVQRTSDKISAL